MTPLAAISLVCARADNGAVASSAALTNTRPVGVVTLAAKELVYGPATDSTDTTAPTTFITKSVT
ncbi:hypothetical protein [Embleya sp. NPDC020886]|uniref:hypothetical protein n=1 Tax=Embleya sp. NPDC020886 TaxID=3363980 RepID=UPI0037887CBC